MKQRLIIFVILGVLILAVDTIFNNESENRITIFESEINSLISTWVEQVGREPTINEVEGIIKQLIDEEILYREAVRLGLDKNDIIIKRRLAQKIGFLRQEAETVLPTQDEVKEFYLKNIKSKMRLRTKSEVLLQLSDLDFSSFPTLHETLADLIDLCQPAPQLQQLSSSQKKNIVH